MDCESCGAEFTPNRPWQKYCSYPCQRREISRRNYNGGYHTEWRRRNAAKINAAQIARDDADPIGAMLKHIKNRSKKYGYVFDLERDDIVIPEVCPVFGVPMIKRTRYAPSIDRIDPSKGYVKGNVQFISRLANTMKNDATLEEQRKFAEWVNQSKPLSTTSTES